MDIQLHKKDFLKLIEQNKITDGRKVIIGITNLSFHRVTGAFVVYVLQKMGFEVESKYSLHEENFKRLKDSEIDMIASVWLPSSHGIYKKEVEKTLGLIELGLHYSPYALWGVPDYVPQNIINEITDLLEPEVLKKVNKSIQGIGEGAGITRFSMQMMKDYQLENAGYTFKTGTQTECILAFEQAVSKKEWVIVPLWQPQFLHHTYNIRELKEPKALLGSVDRAVLLCNKATVEKLFTAKQKDILNKIILSNETISHLDYMFSKEDLSEDEVISKWFKLE